MTTTREERKRQLQIMPRDKILELYKKAIGIEARTSAPQLPVNAMIEAILKREFPNS